MNLGWKVVFLVLFAVCATAAIAQDQVIKVNTTLVSVPVIVSDRQGRYVADLKASDFTLQRDGTNQRIDFFASVEEPINVAVLIDTSHSTEPVIDDIKKAAERFVKLLEPRDRAAVISFDYEPHVLSPLTSDPAQLNKAIKKADIPRQFGTTLRDAVYQTVKDEFAGVTGRKAIILLTDGKDVGSDITTPDLLYSLQESDVMIYSVFFKTGEGGQQFGRGGGGPGRMGGMGGRGGMGGGGVFGGGRFPGNDPSPPRRENPQRRQHAEAVNERAEEFLQNLSDTTAGRFYQSKSSEFKDTFSMIVDELRHQYRLGFYPPEEGTDAAEHDLRVKVSRQDVAVRSRASYRATPSTSK
jgi:VWFA-related protein